MEPIISPWWFWFISVVNTFRAVSIGLLAVSVAMVFSFAFIIAAGRNSLAESKRINPDKKFTEKENELDAEEWWMRVACVVALVSAIFVVFLPNAETMHQMLAAKIITQNNLSIAAETVKKVISYIVNSYAAVRGG